MAIHVQCAVCRRQYRLKDAFAGMAVRCPGCGAPIQVPAASPPSPLPASGNRRPELPHVTAAEARSTPMPVQPPAAPATGGQSDLDFFSAGVDIFSADPLSAAPPPPSPPAPAGPPPAPSVGSPATGGGADDLSGLNFMVDFDSTPSAMRGGSGVSGSVGGENGSALPAPLITGLDLFVGGNGAGLAALSASGYGNGWGAQLPAPDGSPAAPPVWSAAFPTGGAPGDSSPPVPTPPFHGVVSAGTGGDPAGMQSRPVHDYGSEYANYVFNRDRFLLRQKALSINTKYYVWDEQGHPLLFVERPAYLALQFAALGAGVLAGFAAFFLFILPSILLDVPLLFVIGALLGGFASYIALHVVVMLIMPRRHVTIFSDDTKQFPVLHIEQDSKFYFPIATYTVRDVQGRPLARLRKNYLYNLLRKRWEIRNPQGELLCLAKEDSILLGLIRRFITKLLVTNFIILTADRNEVKLGEFNRKYTLLDRYVLDMTPDWQRQLDRRIALALGIMLDTGEGR